jgi:hypothetical protein
VIEFERVLDGDGTRPFTLAVADIVYLEPADEERTRLRVRDHGDVLAKAPYARVRRLISLVRNQLASTLEPDP